MNARYIAILWIAAGSALGAGAEEPAYAEALRACRFPDPPEVADAARATERAMLRATRAVHRYAKAMQTSLACIDAVERRLSGTLGPADHAAITALYNNGVDQLTAISRAHNEQVRRFEARRRLESGDSDVLRDDPHVLGTH